MQIKKKKNKKRKRNGTDSQSRFDILNEIGNQLLKRGRTWTNG